jgi:RNA polymerase sigma-70 factor (ECF subfamily)
VPLQHAPETHTFFGVRSACRIPIRFRGIASSGSGTGQNALEFASEIQRFTGLLGDGAVASTANPIFWWLLIGVSSYNAAMAPADQDQKSGPGSPRHFATTRWSLVLAAGRRSSPESSAALATLCETYWYPLYAYVRRRGHDADDAQDLTQAFFARLLEKNDLAAAQQECGRFRSFLLTALKHFLANEWDRGCAQKRGGSRPLLSIEFRTAEDRYRLEPRHELTAEKIFERRWALVLLEQVLVRLQQESARAGKGELFDRLKVFLTGERAAVSYGELAAELKMTEGAVKVAVHRLRRRYRDVLRLEIGQTVADPAEIEEEIRELVSAIS